MRREDFGLFFTLPLSRDDWENLRQSHVKTVQLVSDFARVDTVRRMRDMGVERIVSRLTNNQFATVDERQHWATRLGEQVEAGVTDILVGVEPDNGTVPQYGEGNDWGQSTAYTFRAAAGEMLHLLENSLPARVRYISAGMTMRSISEDEAPAPGRAVWSDICRPLFNTFDYNGAHIYQYNWLTEIDRIRFKWALKIAQEQWHKELFLDEVGVHSTQMAQLAKMRAYLKMATLLVHSRLGDRVSGFVPFCANGVMSQWAAYIIHDPLAYLDVGRFMAGEDFN